MINVYIVSGPPGSGKSFQVGGFVAAMVKDGEDGVIISADHHHCATLREILNQNESYRGIPFNLLNDVSINEALDNYEFNVEVLATAHPQCFRAFLEALRANEDGNFNVIVDNTNIHEGEIAPYYLAAQAFDAEVEILRVETALDVCIKRGVHGVPEGTVERMHKTFMEERDHPYEAGVIIPKQHMPWWKSRAL